MATRTTKRQPESLILSAVRSFLQLGGWYVVRHQQGLGSHKGFPDLTAIKDGRTVYVEVKTETGKQSDAQIAFQREVETRGAEYIVARSTSDVEHLCDCLRLAERGPSR